MTEPPIPLQSLIDAVKENLLAATQGPNYPIFFIEKVELELKVGVTTSKEGSITISVLPIGGMEIRGSRSDEQYHIIKVSLSPILDREEQRKLINNDERLLQGISRATQSALRKGKKLPESE